VFGKYEGKEEMSGDPYYSDFDSSSAVKTNFHLVRFLRKRFHSPGVSIPITYRFQRSQLMTKMIMDILLTAEVTPYSLNG
jgi:hypothetical protein